MTEIIKNIDSYNKEIISWGNQTRRLLHGKIPRSGQHPNKQEISLSRSLRMSTSKTFGEIDRVGFVFSLHGIFLQKGVGRGYVSKNGIVSRGSRIKNKYNLHAKRTDFRKISGRIVRKPLDWFNSPLQTRFEKLAEIVAEYKADQAVLNFKRMKIQ